MLSASAEERRVLTASAVDALPEATAEVVADAAPPESSSGFCALGLSDYDYDYD